MLVNFDCSALWVRDAEPLKAALSLTPEYLRAKGNMLDYKVLHAAPEVTLHSSIRSFACRTCGLSAAIYVASGSHLFMRNAFCDACWVISGSKWRLFNRRPIISGDVVKQCVCDGNGSCCFSSVLTIHASCTGPRTERLRLDLCVGLAAAVGPAVPGAQALVRDAHVWRGGIDIALHDC